MVLDASGAIELLLNTARGKRLGARLAGAAEVVHAPTAGCALSFQS